MSRVGAAAERLPFDIGDDLDCGCRAVQLRCIKSFEHQTGAEFEEGENYYVCYHCVSPHEAGVVHIEGYYTDIDGHFEADFSTDDSDYDSD